MNDPQLTEKIMGIDLRNAMRLGVILRAMICSLHNKVKRCNIPLASHNFWKPLQPLVKCTKNLCHMKQTELVKKMLQFALRQQIKTEGR